MNPRPEASDSPRAAGPGSVPATEPRDKATAGTEKETAQSALVFSGKGDERIKTSTGQSKTERHEQLIRRAGTMLKRTS